MALNLRILARECKRIALEFILLEIKSKFAVFTKTEHCAQALGCKTAPVNYPPIKSSSFIQAEENE